jgi:hypothetical protein
VRALLRVHPAPSPPHLLGGMAEYMYLRPDTFVDKVPDGLSPRVAVLAELMACAASLDKRGADVVLHMANTPKSFVEGIEMLKRAG